MIATLISLLVLPAEPAMASPPSSPIVEIVMENTSYSKIVGSAKAPFINGTMIAGGLSFTNYFDNTDGSLHDYLAMTDGDIATTDAPTSENIFHQLQSSGTSWAVYEESMPSACYTGTDFGLVPGSTDGLYVKIHNPAMYFNNVTVDPSVCNAHVLPLTTSTFDPNALPAFSYVVPNQCNDMHTQSKNGTANASCPAYFGTNGAANKTTMGDSWLATFVPALASRATVILTWDEGSLTSPQQIVTVEYGLGVSNGTNNDQFNHFNLLGGLETLFGIPLINGAAGQTPLPIPSSSPPPPPTITSFSPTSGPQGTSVTISGTNFTGASDVRFNTTSAGAGNFTVDSDIQITATVPGGFTSSNNVGPISVANAGGTGTSVANFTANIPAVSSFTNDHGNPGTSVTLTGTNYTGATSVKFNGTTASFSVTDSTHISATVPSGATTGGIVVATPTGTSAPSSIYTVPSATVIGQATGDNSTAPNVTVTGSTSVGDTVVALITSSTGPSSTSSRPPNWSATKEINGAMVETCANCPSAYTSGVSNLSFAFSIASNWTLTVVDVRGLANGAVDLTASYTSGANSVTTLDSGLTGTTLQASEVVLANMMEVSTQAPTLCSPSCLGTFSSLAAFQSKTNTGQLTAIAYPSATSTFEAFGTISTAAKARGVIVTLK